MLFLWYVRVAQLDRAFASGAKGQGFNSLLEHQMIISLVFTGVFNFHCFGFIWYGFDFMVDYDYSLYVQVFI